MQPAARPERIVTMSIFDNSTVAQLIDMAKQEDLGSGDVTTALMAGQNEPAEFRLIARQPGVFAGRELAPAILSAYDQSIEITWSKLATDGSTLEHSTTELATLTGPLGSILAAERVLLNFLQRLSGIATRTKTFVDAIAGTHAAIYDTRKTTPGWRTLEKYAVRCGGGQNHRQGLFDAVLIKDNHLAGVDASRLAAEIFEMLNKLPTSEHRPTFIEVEADTLAQFTELLKVVGIDIILLDNFSVDHLREAVALRDSHGLAGKVALEASGGITLETVRSVAETGVERISVGAITHGAPAIDLALERGSC